MINIILHDYACKNVYVDDYFIISLKQITNSKPKEAEAMREASDVMCTSSTLSSCLFIMIIIRNK